MYQQIEEYLEKNKHLAVESDDPFDMKKEGEGSPENEEIKDNPNTL